MKPIPGLLPAAALLGLAACGSRARVDADSGGAALMRNLLRAGTVELALPAGPVYEPARRAARLRTRERDGYVLTATGGDARLSRVVLGSQQDPRARALVERMGVRTGVRNGQAWFSIAELEFAAPDDALLACFEDPERPGLPLTLYYANDDEHAARLAAHELGAGWKPSLRAWGAGRELLRGPLALGGRVDPARLARSPGLDSEPLAPRTDGIGGSVQKGADPGRLAELLDELARARAALRAWAAPASALPHIELVAYARAEDYTRVAGSAGAAALDPLARAVHACLAPGLPSAGAAEAARATGRALLGECACAWLEDGAALDAAGRWWGEPLESWLAWIAARGLVLPLERVVDPRADEEVSPHLLLPLRAALFRVLRETRGDEELRALWSGAHAFAPDVALGLAFEKSLAARAAAAPAGLASVRGAGFPALAPDGRQAWRGVEGEPTLAGEGWASEAGERSVALAQELGANAFGLRISLVAHPDPLALPDPFHPRRMGTREGDLQVWAALAAARARGMASFVDLDVLASPSGVEDGVWLRVRPDQWSRFFAARGAALVHAGLLAQLGRADALSIGCELSAVTRDQVEGRTGKQADLDAKRAGWTEMVARARRAYSGALVYVASPVDLPLVLFWRDLDAVGYRLDLQPAPGAGYTPVERQDFTQHVRGALEQVAAVASAQHKPWFLARTGFEPAPAAPGLRLQLEALGSALLTLPPESRPAASFLWRWPSDPGEQPLDPRDELLPREATLETLRRLWRVL
jgi:hypothetical protein